jgi:hypothetical protein
LVLAGNDQRQTGDRREDQCAAMLLNVDEKTLSVRRIGIRHNTPRNTLILEREEETTISELPRTSLAGRRQLTRNEV